MKKDLYYNTILTKRYKPETWCKGKYNGFR